MRRLRQSVLSSLVAARAFEISHWGEALRLRPLRQGVRRQIQSTRPHANARGDGGRCRGRCYFYNGGERRSRYSNNGGRFNRRCIIATEDLYSSQLRSMLETIYERSVLDETLRVFPGLCRRSFLNCFLNIIVDIDVYIAVDVDASILAFRDECRISDGRR